VHFRGRARIHPSPRSTATQPSEHYRRLELGEQTAFASSVEAYLSAAVITSVAPAENLRHLYLNRQDRVVRDILGRDSTICRFETPATAPFAHRNMYCCPVGDNLLCQVCVTRT